MFWTRSSTPRGRSGSCAVDAVDQQFGIAEDRVQRRAQLVAHIGEELRFVLAGERQLLALVGDLAEQARILDRQYRLAGQGLHQPHRLRREFARPLAAAATSPRECARRRPTARSAPSESRRRGSTSRSGLLGRSREIGDLHRRAARDRLAHRGLGLGDPQIAHRARRAPRPSRPPRPGGRRAPPGCSGRSRRHPPRSARPSGSGSSTAPRRRSSVELTACPTSFSTFNSSTERPSSAVRARNSLNSRAFSIAITAWSAKVVTRCDLLFGERLDPLARQRR